MRKLTIWWRRFLRLPHALADLLRLPRIVAEVAHGTEVRLADAQRKIEAIIEGQTKVILSMLQARGALSILLRTQTPDLFAPAPPITGLLPLNEQLERLRARVPKAFALWSEAFEAGRRTYTTTPDGNLSINTSALGHLFGAFISIHAVGTALDIGCGPQPVPIYLTNASLTSVAGIDPIGTAKDHPFTFAPSLSEFLPFADKAFDTVIIATSLDHVLLLDQALAEIHRVLKHSGKLLIWVGFIPGAPRYNPYSPDIARVDQYHLFQFDQPWFESEMANRFIIVEKMPVDSTSWFYAFAPIVPAENNVP